MANRDYFDKITTLLKYFGNLRLKERDTKFSKFWALFIFTCGCIQELTFITYIFYNINDLKKVLDTIPDAVMYSSALFQFATVVVYRKEWRQLIKQIEDIIKHDQVNYKEKEYRKNAITKLFESKNFEINIIFGINFTTLVWFIPPLINGNGKLPFNYSRFPFDDDKYYYFVFAFQVFTNLILTTNFILSALLSLKVCVKLTDLFSMLEHSLNNVIDNSGKNEDVYLKKFIKCARFHDAILRSCNLLQKSNSLNFLNVFYFFLAGLCFGAFSLSEINNLDSNVFMLLLYIFYISTTVFIIVWAVEQIGTKGEDVSRTLYNINWEDVDVKLQKHVLFMLRRNQNFPEFSAASLFIISYKTQLDMIRLTFSYYTFLKKFNT